MQPKATFNTTSLLQRAWLTRGPLAIAMWPLGLLYGFVVRVRRAFYDFGWLSVETPAVPVIVVGNLIAGGAGKTPTTIAIVQMLRRAGYKPGVISRGYGRRESSSDEPIAVSESTPAEHCGDEPLLLHLRTQAPVVVSRDRVAAARRLLELAPAVNVLISDDGLQHRRMGRTAQVLVFDERGAGNGWLLPAGPLREPMPGNVPPRSLVLYNAPAASTDLPGDIARRSLSGFAPLAEWRRGAPPTLEAIATLRERARPLVAVAGMAHPQRFFAMLRDCGLTFVEYPLPDHHDYVDLPWPADTSDVIVTEKDAVKIDPQRIGKTNVWVATLDFATPPSFDAALLALLSPAPRDPR